MKAFVSLLLVVSLFTGARSLAAKICSGITLDQYNVDPAPCASKFVIASSTSRYAIHEPIHVRITGATLDATFASAHLIARDESGAEVGSWVTTSELRSDNTCGGVTYEPASEQTSIEAVWQVSIPVTGKITIKVTIIEDDSTIYTNCYDIILVPRVIDSGSVTGGKELEPNTTTTITTTTATTTTTTTTTTTSTTTSAQTSATTTTALPANTTTVSPTADVSVNVTWTFAEEGNVTSVVMTIKNLKSGQWAAAGFGQAKAMGEAHVFMCKRLMNNTVVLHRYMNPNKHHEPEPAGSEQGGVLTPGQQVFSDGVVTCQFTLSNFTTQETSLLKDLRPLSQSGQYHPLIAIGVLDNDNEPQQHAHDSRMAQDAVVQLNQNGVVLYRVSVAANDLTFVRTHGILMIFSWILIVSTGVLISRYFKAPWANQLICGKAAWFAAHRFLMSLAAILTLLGFFFILVFLKGAWINRIDARPFAHSITGVLVISLAFFQPFIALFRCEPDSHYRFIFNYLHGFIGFTAFILSIATLYLATFFHIFKNSNGRVVMIIWIVWVGLVFVVFELIEYRIRKKLGGSAYTNINNSTGTLSELVESPASPKLTLTRFENQTEAAAEQKWKNIFLAVHVLVAATLSVVLTTFIL